jgi:kynurenine formamidase
MLIDLSHPIEDGMRVYPGLPIPRVGASADHDASRPRYEGKAEFHLGEYSFTGAAGTYLDSPFHRHRELGDLASLPLEGLVGLPGVVLDHRAGEDRRFDSDVVREELQGRAVLLRTGWSARWGTDGYWEAGPFLAGHMLEWLVEAPAAIVGIDIWNLDDVDDLTRPAHTGLLAAGIPIVENLASLERLPRSGFRFTAVPPRVVGGSNFPVRAFAEV